MERREAADRLPSRPPQPVSGVLALAQGLGVEAYEPEASAAPGAAWRLVACATALEHVFICSAGYAGARRREALYARFASW